MENNNKIPKILKLSLFLCLLGIFSGGILSLVNEFTEKIVEQNKIKAELKEVLSSGVEEESLLLVENVKNSAIKKMYRAQTTDAIPCYVFVVEDKNPFTTVKTIIVVEITTEKILNIKVSPGSTSHNKDNLMEESNFGVIGENIASFNEKFQIVTGATDSSKSVKRCLEAVYNELSMMTGKATFKALKQCLPEITNYEYTFVIEDKEVTLLLKYNESNKTFEYLKTLSGEIKEEVIDECKALAIMNFPTEYIKNVYNDASGTLLTIVTDKGYKGTIVAEVKIYNKRIIDFTLKESNENYHRNPNYTYEGNVEDYIFEQYSLGIKDTIVTGATVTSLAINHLLLMAEHYIASLGGTNNG